MDHRRYLVAQHQLGVSHQSMNFETVAGEFNADGTQKERKITRIIQPDQIFDYEELDSDPVIARQIAEDLVTEVPHWCVDIAEEDRAIYAAARWANDAEVRAFAEVGVVTNG
jgi:hypothetical protein